MLGNLNSYKVQTTKSLKTLKEEIMEEKFNDDNRDQYVIKVELKQLTKVVSDVSEKVNKIDHENYILKTETEEIRKIQEIIFLKFLASVFPFWINLIDTD